MRPKYANETRWLIWISILIGVVRPLLLFVALGHHASQSYQAVAHLWIGALAAGWYIESDRLCRGLFLSLTAIEIACAAVTIIQKI